MASGRRFRVARGDVLHVVVPQKGRHLGIAIDRGPNGETVFAVATSGDWKAEPLRRVIDFSAEPARGWIGEWPKDNGELSYFYGDFIDVYPPDAWLKVIGRVPPAAVDALLDLFYEWDTRRSGPPAPPGPIRIPPP